jgi:hypothetical protein
MQTHFKHISIVFLCCLFFSSCYNSRKLVTDEIVFENGNTQTGTILQCDTAQIKLKKMDESVVIIPWSAIDTVQGKKYKTFFLGVNYGYHYIPYFSVFRNEKMTGSSIGKQFKAGMAYRGNKLYYATFMYSPATPYNITKFGIGFQRYLGESGYLKKTGFFVGTEFNFMNAKYNNGAQTTLEPFTGYELKCTSQLRFHFKLQLQFNLANKNNQTGVSTTIGIHFLKRNFKRYYNQLNTEHRLPRK